jgi:hypothetical protein
MPSGYRLSWLFSCLSSVSPWECRAVASSSPTQSPSKPISIHPYLLMLYNTRKWNSAVTNQSRSHGQVMMIYLLAGPGDWRDAWHFHLNESLLKDKGLAMKTYWGSGGISPRILNISARWRWAVSFTSRSLYLRGKSLRYQLVGSQSRSGRVVSRS